ncbi:MAG TPA: response regulator, partial [Candidatus Rubrimentiphilum sp.]|nr:response regulator [Candidatus Rubrimentiphilum sp.]
MTSASFTVMLITDDPLYGARLRRAFIRAGRGVCLFLAGTGATSLPPVQARAFPQPHVILVDLDAGGKYAEASLRWLRKDRQLADVPIVMLGAEDQNDLVAAGYRAGANACVRKPLAEEAMNEIARSIGDYAYLLQIRPDAA